LGRDVRSLSLHRISLGQLFGLILAGGRCAVARLRVIWGGLFVTGLEIDGSLLSECAVEAGRPAALTLPAGSVEDTCQWLVGQRAGLRGVLDEFGAVYLRNSPVRTPADFALVRDAIMAERASYKENATPRSAFGDDVYSSTDLPAAQAIRPHNENSYTLTFPGLLLFGCLVPPESGGATPVTDVRKVKNGIPAGLVDRFRAAGWALVRNYSEYFGLPWRTAFATDDPAVVAAYCAANLIAYEWRDDGGLRTAQRRSALISHPRTGEEVWFNHLVFWSEWSLDPETREVMVEALGAENLPFSTAFGTGEPVTEQEIGAIEEAYRAATVRESWRAGDLLIVDNILAAHGREAFVGDRKILVAMGEPVQLADCRPTVDPLPGFAGAASSAATGGTGAGS
jgi:hypothetical protein